MKKKSGSIFSTSSRLLTFLLLIAIVKPNICHEHSSPDETAEEFGEVQIQHSIRNRRYHRFHGQQTDQNSNRRTRANDQPKIRTKLGEIEGLELELNGKKVQAFFGVPFAQPPVGEFRFKPPIPIKPWSKPYQANKPAKSCYQTSDTEYPFRGADMWNAKTEKSEDCLYMNMWVPVGVENATTMVWLYGGGFWYGSASLDIYNGLGLAAEGRVIVVAPNYRMGAFGFLFLDHPEVPGNLGLLDQQLALKWIKENIAAFNGDPSKVNLFGESAGAASIVAHMVSRDSWSLFRNGILQSGTLDNPWSMDTPAKALTKSLTVVRSLNCSYPSITDTVNCLKNKTAKQLDDAIWSIGMGYLEFPLVIVSRDRAGFFLRDAYESLRKGEYKPQTDLMFGINQDEGTFWMVYYQLRYYFDPFNHSIVPGEKLINSSLFSECVNEIVLKKQPQVYKSAALWEYGDKEQCRHQINGDPTFYRNQLNQLIGDYFFTCDSLWLAEDVARRQRGRVYVYHFEQRIGSNPWPKWMGVMHGYEVEYIFGLPLLNPQHHQSFISFNNTFYNYTPEDRTFSKDVIHYWSTFAATGVPKIRGQNSRRNSWPPYKLEDKAWYILNARTSGQSLYKQKESECKMWRSVRDIEYQLHEKSLSGANSTSFQVRTLLTIATIGLVILSAMKCT